MSQTETLRTVLPTGCPVDHDASAFLPYFAGDLYARLGIARAQQSVFYCDEIDHWVVTKYRDVVRVLQDTGSFSAQNATTRLTPMHADALKIIKDGSFTPTLTQASVDPPDHTRVRAATNPLMNTKVAALLEGQIRGIVRGYVERLAGKDRVDLVRELIYELPARVIFLLLGVPDNDVTRVKELAVGRTQIDFSPSTYEQQMQGARNLVGLWQYTVALVQDRMRTPQEDFTSGLLRIRNGNDAVLTLNEVNTITYGIFFAGHETTTNQLTNTIREMLIQRANWDAICSDPLLIPNAVEEGFRFCGAVIGWRRRVRKAVQVGDVVLSPGSNVMLSFASANRDEAVFEDPDVFDVRRKNARRHLTLGNGIHFCLGAPLARLEMKIILEEFSRAYPAVRLVEGADGTYVHTFVFRAPDSLMVDLRPSG